MATVIILLDTTGAGTFTVPANWNSASNTIECIGGGGSNNATQGSGGRGGSYARISNVTLTPGATTYIQVGDPTSFSTGNNTWFNKTSNTAPTTTTDGVLARGGNTSTTNIGTLTYLGGSPGAGGGSAYKGSLGGGGAAGPNGIGGNGGGNLGSPNGAGGSGGGGADGGTNGGFAFSSPTNGGNNRFGTGAGTAGTSSSNGSPGTAGGGGGGGYGGGSFGLVGSDGGAGGDYTPGSGSYSGGGGGGGGYDFPNYTYSHPGGVGGLYGGGGGGSSFYGNASNALGARGVVVITYDSVLIVSASITETLTLADSEAGVKVHNATAVEPVNVADVAQCFGFGTIDNTQDVVWVQVDNRQ